MKNPTLPDIRERIARVEADLAALPEVGRTRAEREASLRQFARDAAEEGAKHLRYALATDNPVAALTVRPELAGAIDFSTRLAAWIGPDRLADALISYLPDDDADALTAEERAARVATLEAELLDLGHREEDLIEASEAAGTPIARRANAEPAVILRPPKAAP